MAEPRPAEGPAGGVSRSSQLAEATGQPLWRLAQRGDSAGVAAALASGSAAAIDADDGAEGVTALSHAAAQGHEDVVRQLLRYGASLEVADARGQTPLLWAVTQGHARVVQLLIRHGAKPNAATTAGNNAFHLACKVVCKNVFNPEGMALLKVITDAGVDPAQKNHNGFTGAEFLAGAGAHGAQWLAQLDRLLQPIDPTSATATRTGATTATSARGVPLPWVTELERVVRAPPARELSSRGNNSIAQDAQHDPVAAISVLLSYRTDELSSFGSKLRRALQNSGFVATTVSDNRDRNANRAVGVDGRTALGWVKGIGELLYSLETAAGAMAVASAAAHGAGTGIKLVAGATTAEHSAARFSTTITRVWGGLEERGLLRILNCAAHQAAAIRSRTIVTMVADAAATELVLRQINRLTPADPDTNKGRAAALAILFKRMLAGVSEVALLDHVGPCITAAEQRLFTSGVESDSDAEAVQVASEALVESLDARDAERTAVRKRRRDVQVWTSANVGTIPSTAEKIAAIAAIGGVGGQAPAEDTAQQAREKKLVEKRQGLQHAHHMAPLHAAAVLLQAAARGWIVRSCGSNAPMPFDWHSYHAVCSVDAVVAVVSRTFGMGDAAQCAAYVPPTCDSVPCQTCAHLGG